MNLQRMIQFARSGGNPVGMLQQMAQQDPMAQQAMRLVGGKDARQLRTMAENMARERGVNLQHLAGQMGLRLPE